MIINRTTFFGYVRGGSLLGPTLSQSEVDGLNAILDAMADEPISYVAYALATAYLETWHTMQPIEEKGGDAYFFRMYDPGGNNARVAHMLGNTQPGDGALFHGRGYVQLTGRTNYMRAGDRLGIDLLSNPSLALEPDIAAKIMRDGMDDGWFTGVGFAHYLPIDGLGDLDDFTQARRIINGQDRAADIAGYAMRFQGALQ